MTLRELRESKHLSLNQMAEIIGKSRGSINAYELGKTKIPDEVYAKVFERFGVELRSPATTPSTTPSPATTPSPDDIQPAEAKPATPVETKEPATTEVKEPAGKKEPAKTVSPMDGTILKAIRSAHNLSQVKMAEIIGKSPSSVINYEKGVSMVPVDAVHRLEKWLATTPSSSTPATTTPAPASASTTSALAAPSQELEETKTEKGVDEKVGEETKAEPGVDEKAGDEKPHVYIQSMAGSTISVHDIIARVIDVVPSVENIYVKPEENRAYWTAGKNNGSTVLW